MRLQVTEATASGAATIPETVAAAYERNAAPASDEAPQNEANSTETFAECTRRDLNPHALGRRNLRAQRSGEEGAMSRKDDDAIDEERRTDQDVGNWGVITGPGTMVP
jgi:hypothetical protein